jgi:GAF domain-containing protein
MAKRARKPAKRATASRRTRANAKKKSARPKAAKLKPRASKGVKPKSAKSKPDIARLERELRIARDRQAATSDILRVISQSPADVRPVFEAIVLAAVRLIHCDLAFFLRCDGKFYSGTARATPEGLKSDIRPPQPIDPEANFPSRAIIAKTTLHLPDWSLIELPDNERQVHEKFGINCALYVPMLHDGECIGLLTLAGKQTNSFGESEIALAESFRDQALIAIENTRLFNEAQEALERQTATADILKVIASSPSDVQPVFDAIAANANRLVGGFATAVFRFVDGVGHLAAFTQVNPTADEMLKVSFPRPIADIHFFQTTKAGEALQISDTEDQPMKGLRDIARARGFRSVLYAPLMSKGASIGVIATNRSNPGPFSAHHVQLLQTFADQAVIAIENVRLFNETKEALERQTAISEILRVISSSPGDVQPVLATVAQYAAQICEAQIVDILIVKDDRLHYAAELGEFGRIVYGETAPINRETVMGRSVCDKQPVHVVDLQSMDHDFPLGREYALALGHRTTLAVPLIREDRALGTILVRRTDVRPFDDRHIALLKTFADQAAIAIENARLFDEVQAKTKDLTEALAYQTGSSNVLRVIASSPTDVDPVLKAIVESARELCEANDAVALLKDGENLRFSAHSGPIAVKHDRWPINRNWTAGRAFVDQKPVHVHDMLSEEGAEFPVARAMGQTTGSTIHTVLSVPLLRGDESIGAILLRRTELRPFTEKQVDLLSTFADQAVIAIQNARMFNETREALEQQKASADILNVISNSVAETQPVFDEILRSVARLFGSQENFIFLVGEDGLLHVGAGSGPRVEQVRGLFPTPLDGTVSQVAIRERRLVRSANVFNDPELPLAAREGYRRLGENYSMVVAPMLWEDRAIGSIMVARTSMTAFSEKECTLLRTFADQAVIAIQNARLFDQVQAKTTDLEESLQQQTATADVLKVISRSAFDLQTVLDTLVESAAKLCEADEGIILQPNESGFGLAANWGLTPGKKEFIQSRTFRPGSSTLTGRVLTDGNVVHIRDVFEEPGFSSEGDPSPARTRLGVPLLRDGSPVGVFVLTRLEMQPFTEKQIELVSTFSDQAVIAIENARLFDEVQARTKELAASLDDLRTAQDRLVQTEKLASLGQLTAGIAHEIKNPLNFVNNFSALSAELTDELNDLLKPAPLADKLRQDVDELTGLIKDNLQKVVQHGKRADSIVKNMLLHSREGSGEQRPMDINALLDESLNLAYHGARAEKPGFNITLQRDFDEGAGSIEGFPQEITRAFLNLISNGFYAATKRWADNGEADFEPQLSATTKDLGGHVEIRIRDNGTGIPPEVKEKMFNPFFTTKPAGEGTGLGLSMSHDIIVKQHGGRIDVITEPGRFTEFTVLLPRTIRK